MGRYRYMGKRLRVLGKRVIDILCCCGPPEPDCCEGAGGPPTADFTYTQLSETPCSIQFTDESIPGLCGDIVSWAWNFGDTTTSTEQHPLKTFGTVGPYTVTLTVTDAEGCIDTVEMEVECVPMGGCFYCLDQLPSSISITLSGYADALCPECDSINGNHILERGTIFLTNCVWTKRITLCAGTSNETFVTIQVQIGCGSSGLLPTGIYVTVGGSKVGGGFGSWGTTWRKLLAPITGCVGGKTCRGTHVATYFTQSNTGSGSIPCFYPTGGSVTVVI